MEAEEWKANPIVWGYFIPLNFFLSLSFFRSSSSHSSPNAVWVCVAALSKAYVSEAAPQNKSPCDVLLIPTLSFDYSTIILYLCVSWKGREGLITPVIFNTAAVHKPQDVF